MSWKERFIFIAHRGASAYEPENTIRAFMKAIELGADVVELDVRATAEGIPVVVHDESLERIAGVPKRVSELSIDELKKYRVFGKEPIPTLDEALEYLDNRVGIFIELKEKGLEDKVLEIINRYRIEENILLISFHIDILRRIREMNSKIDIGLITVRHVDLRQILKLRPFAILPQYSIVNPRTVKEIHAHKLRVYVWTINDISLGVKMMNYGVDGIATDRPDIRHQIAKQRTLTRYLK